jgi:hypothetical protein
VRIMKKTSAQKIMRDGYGDSFMKKGDTYDNITRNLDFRVSCENIEDAIKCIELIGGYNDFSPERVSSALRKNFGGTEQSSYNKDIQVPLYSFSVGRESSPVLYVRQLQADNDKENKEDNFIKEAFVDEFTSSNNESRFWWD